MHLEVGMGEEGKFGLSASAKLEVKMEVPTEASGRLVHAALDVVSPANGMGRLTG